MAILPRQTLYGTNNCSFMSDIRGTWNAVFLNERITISVPMNKHYSLCVHNFVEIPIKRTSIGGPSLIYLMQPSEKNFSNTKQ